MYVLQTNWFWERLHLGTRNGFPMLLRLLPLLGQMHRCETLPTGILSQFKGILVKSESGEVGCQKSCLS